VLAALDADKARLVELRYFTGLTIEETAEMLGRSRDREARVGARPRLAPPGDHEAAVSAERWDEVERLFAEALDRPASGREAWVFENAPNEAVWEEVLSLLRAHDAAGGVLDRTWPPALAPSASPRSVEVLRPGERFGPYEVAGRLASGGMGLLYRALDTRLGREVAVKLVAPHLADDPRALQRFEKEARAVAALAHPNIVALFDVGKEGGRAFAVLELLRGESLRERLRRGPLTLPGRGVARDVSRPRGGHAAGLVHRDLKPRTSS
jgi:hypothetical protein